MTLLFFLMGKLSWIPNSKFLFIAVSVGEPTILERGSVK